MGERWVWLLLRENETLRCFSCDKYLHDKKIYRYLYADSRLDDVLCETCWMEETEE